MGWVLVREAQPNHMPRNASNLTIERIEDKMTSKVPSALFREQDVCREKVVKKNPQLEEGAIQYAPGWLCSTRARMKIVHGIWGQ